MTDSYNQKVEQIRELERKHKFSEACAETRKLSCKHMAPTGQDYHLKEIGGIFPYSRMSGPCLQTMSEYAGKISGEERRLWDKEASASLECLYKCALTGEDCIAKESGYHNSEIPSGDYPYIYVKIDTQQRCPACNLSEDLAKKLRNLRDENMEEK